MTVIATHSRAGYNGAIMHRAHTRTFVVPFVLPLVVFSSVLFSLIFLGLFLVAPEHASAQTPCFLIGQNSTPPQGFGTPYSVQTAAREMLVTVSCGSSSGTSNATVTVGSGQQSEYIYKEGYSWENGAWQKFTLTGSQPNSVWFLGSAQATLVKTAAQLAQTQYVVAYVCQWVGVWKCGCADAACATPSWQMQAYKTGGVPQGGTTSGTTGNTTSGTTGNTTGNSTGSTTGNSGIPTQKIDILPLGDSITALGGDRSYKGYLADKLTAAGYNFQYIGSQGSGTQKHEGHSGWKTAQIRDSLPGWLNSYTPDLVLLHIGTNDALAGRSGTLTLNEIEQIIQRLRAGNPNVKIVLAKIIPAPIRTSSVGAVKTQNDGTDALAQKLSTSQSPIVVADLFTPMDPSKDIQNEPCRCHQTVSGAQKMATAWFAGVQKMFNQ